MRDTESASGNLSGFPFKNSRRMRLSAGGRVALTISLLYSVLGLPCAGYAEDGTGLSSQQRAALRAIARGEWPDWPEMTQAQARAVYEKAEAYLERYVPRHLPQGINADILYTDRNRSAVVMYEGLGDGAIWTGHYLAALALKYHVTEDAVTLERLHRALDALTTLSRVTANPGFIARYAGRADDPAYAAYYRRYGNWDEPELPEIGRQAYRGSGTYRDYVWLGNSTRDTYDGVLFGLVFTRVFVADATVQRRVAAISEPMLRKLLQDRFWIRDGQGHVKNPVPVFTCAWTCFALDMNPWLRLIPEPAGLVSCYAPRMTVTTYAQAYRNTLPIAVLTEGHVTSKWKQRYSSNNLTFILCASGALLEKAPREKALWRNMTRLLYAGARDHLNAHFAAIYLLVTGNRGDQTARATLQGQLIDFPTEKWRRHVDLRGNPDITWHNDTQSEYALPVSERIPEDFMWQRTPCNAVGGWDMPYEYPGIDVFLPYWMGRVAGVIPSPD